MKLNKQQYNLADDGIMIAEGLDTYETGTPDMHVNSTAGVLRNGTTRYRVAAGDITVTAASASTSKLAIIEKTTNSTAVPTAKYGTEVGTGAVTLVNGGVADTVNYDTTNVVRDIKITNTSGSDYTITAVSDRYQFENNTCTITWYWSADNAGDPIWASKTQIGTDTRTWPDNLGKDVSMTGLSITLANNTSIHIFSRQTGNATAARSYRDYAGATLASGIATVGRKSTDGGSTWAADDYCVSTCGFDSVTAGAPNPAYPSADANNIILAYVGTVATPIIETTTAIVEGTPGANQVKLTKNDSGYRL